MNRAVCADSRVESIGVEETSRCFRSRERPRQVEAGVSESGRLQDIGVRQGECADS